MKFKCWYYRMLSLLWFFILLFPVLGYSDEPLLSLKCPDQIVCGTHITIPLMLSNAPEIDSFGIELQWFGQITFKGYSFQGCLTEGFDFIDCNAPEINRLKIGGFTTKNGIAAGSSGCLVTLEFEVAAQCNPNKFGIIIASLFDDLKGMEIDDCEPAPISSTTTIRPRPTTTTTVPVCTVSINPQTVTLASKAAQRFKVLTTCDSSVVEGRYKWELSPASTIGSAITGDGLFFAGNNQTDSDVQETVKVTDRAHNNASASAVVTIKRKEIPIPECEVTITPSTETIYTRETISFAAETICDGEPAQGTYLWSVNSTIESTIDDSGLYTSALTDTEVTDTITVTDTAHGNVTDTVSVSVIGTYIEIWPDPMLRSHLMWLPALIFINGTNTHFDLTTTISFTPAAEVTPLFQLYWCPTLMWSFALINPNFNQVETSPLTITASTPAVSETIHDTIDLSMLPWILKEEKGR